MNVFLIGSPLQLLNAIEAKHFLNLTNNHLIMILGLGYSNERGVYEQLICKEAWDSVRYVKICERALEFQSTLFGEYLSGQVRRFWNLYRRYSNRKRLDNIAKSLSAVNNIILGNYLEEGELYMRHFANTLRHKNLYLVDDGTDALKVNDERRKKVSKALLSEQAVDNLSLWKRMKRNVREAFIEWNNTETKNVIFFTAYDIDVRDGDQVVRNEYCHLRKQVAHNVQSNDVFFLGQSLIEDKWIEKQVYFDYLKTVRSYFAEKELFYVPHPRESLETVSYVGDILGFKIERTDVPIEYHIALKDNKPKVLASFFCSALLNCSIVYAQDLSIKAFHIDPRHILINPELVRDIYEYFNNKASQKFEIVKL